MKDKAKLDQGTVTYGNDSLPVYAVLKAISSEETTIPSNSSHASITIPAVNSDRHTNVMVRPSKLIYEYVCFTNAMIYSSDVRPPTCK